MERLKGKTALITGCNRGIGKAIMAAFLREGASVIACTRVINDGLLAMYQEMPGNVFPVAIDLADEASIKRGMKEAMNLGNIDILVNNAGIARFAPFVMSKMDDFKNMMQVNFFAHVLITQYVVKSMLKQKCGSIINLSSVSGLDAIAGNSAYGASKAAIASLTRTLSKELARINIRVNAIAPGFVETDMNTKISKEYMEQALSHISLGRLAHVDEIAHLAVFLASDEASYITGQIIRIDGGL